MNVLQLLASDNSPVYLDDNQTVTVYSSERKTVPAPCDRFTSNFAEYISILEHNVIDPHCIHGVTTRRVLCAELLRSDLWFSIYLRYGSRLCRILMGSYEVYQQIPLTKSYIQVSGRDLASICSYGPRNTKVQFTQTNSGAGNNRKDNPYKILQLSGNTRPSTWSQLTQRSKLSSSPSTSNAVDRSRLTRIALAQHQAQLIRSRLAVPRTGFSTTPTPSSGMSSPTVSPTSNAVNRSRLTRIALAQNQAQLIRSRLAVAHTDSSTTPTPTPSSGMSSPSVSSVATFQMSPTTQRGRRPGSVTPTSRLQACKLNGVSPNSSLIGSHMFALQSRPATSPDRLFGSMTYTRWYFGVFNHLPTTNSPCDELKRLHRYLNELAFRPLVDKLTSKERAESANPKIFANIIPHWKIKQLIKKTLASMGVKSLFSKACYIVILKCLQDIFTANLYTKQNTSRLTHSVKISLCSWVTKLADSSTHADRVKHVQNLIHWLIKLISYVIKYFFYVTESREHRKRTLFFLREYWNSKADNTLQQYITSGVFQPVPDSTPPTTRFRFVAGPSKLRPILSTIKSCQSPSDRYKLLDVLACLKYMRSDEGNGIAACHDQISQIRKFNADRHLADQSQRGLYFVKTDISKCYDSINRKLLLEIIKKRLIEMGVGSFVCWRLAVIMSGKEKPTITYTDHVDVNIISQSSRALTTLMGGARSYLSKKGISSAIVVPLHRREISSDQLLGCVREHLEGVVLSVSNAASHSQQYRMVDGIPQGSILSSVLCDIYYGDMENKYLSNDFRAQGTLLMRYVDDYLLLTDEESYAHRFITTLTSGELREEYSCVIKPEKTSTNSSLVTLSAADKQDIELCYDEIRWCQYLIDPSNFCVKIPHYTTHDVENSVSFNGTVKPVSHIRTLMLKHVSVFANPLYFDSKVNSADIIQGNVMEILRLSAVKFCYLTRFLPDYNSLYERRSGRMWIDVIMSLSSRLYKVISNHYKRNGDQLVLTQQQLNTWCLEVFDHQMGSWQKLCCLRKQLTAKVVNYR